ncbi:MAG: amidohydrolase family protein [Arenibacter algicola]|nr:amidohydrolase family protein [Arenibacter algicola]
MRFDAHVHFNTFNEAFLNYGIENGMRFLSIVTDMPFFPSIKDQLTTILKIKKIYPDQIDFATTFSCNGWGGSNWLSKSLDNIDKSMNLGAVGVKVWKNIGMSLKDDKGNYVMIDHPSFEPIFQFLEDYDILLLGHNGEPKNCWLPTKDMTVESDKAYFMAHPEYHMFHHPEVPNYEAQLRARNNLLKRHPNLRFVGLHLASQEWDTNEVGAFLDQFPNAMVDLAERICHLQYQTIDHWKKIYDFFITYQDRIIYGTDIVVDNSLTDDVLIQHMNERYQNHRKYFTENEWMTVQKVNGKFKGLGLPVSVVDKVYSANALKTYK